MLVLYMNIIYIKFYSTDQTVLKTQPSTILTTQSSAILATPPKHIQVI
jgi:hypothetical protein